MWDLLMLKFKRLQRYRDKRRSPDRGTDSQGGNESGRGFRNRDGLRVPPHTRSSTRNSAKRRSPGTLGTMPTGGLPRPQRRLSRASMTPGRSSATGQLLGERVGVSL